MEGNGTHQPKRGTPRATPPEARGIPGIEVAHSVLGYDKVWFTRHAIQRMKQRRVSREQVFSVLERPAKKGLRTQAGRFRWRRNGIDVIFEKWPDKLCIITVIRDAG
jgi:hypothetical protein